MHLANGLFAFEPSHSYRMSLDHAFRVPLLRAGLKTLPAIVPIVINAAAVTTIAQCYDLWASLARRIATRPGTERVAILATGGLSQSAGEPQIGEIGECFDRELLACSATGSATRKPITPAQTDPGRPL